MVSMQNFTHHPVSTGNTKQLFNSYSNLILLSKIIFELLNIASTILSIGKGRPIAVLECLSDTALSSPPGRLLQKILPSNFSPISEMNQENNNVVIYSKLKLIFHSLEEFFNTLGNRFVIERGFYPEADQTPSYWLGY